MKPKKRRKFHTAIDGEWINIVMTNLHHKCCKCGLKHRMDFKIIRKNERNNLKVRFIRK